MIFLKPGQKISPLFMVGQRLTHTLDSVLDENSGGLNESSPHSTEASVDGALAHDVEFRDMG